MHSHNSKYKAHKLNNTDCAEYSGEHSNRTQIIPFWFLKCC